MAESLTAIVNHGRWLVACPYCNGAELLTTDGMFICRSCMMKMNGGKPLPARLPDESVLIDAALSVRRAENRNWTPPETVEDLLRENIAHGLGG